MNGACALQKPAEERTADRRDLRAEILTLVGFADHIFPEACTQKMCEIPDDVYHERYMQLCDMLELDEFADRPVRTLRSDSGTRGRACGRRSAPPGPVLILDEPTIGDGCRRQGAHPLFLKELEQRLWTTGICLTTHDMTDIEKVCARGDCDQ